MEKEKVFLIRKEGLLKAYNEGCPDVKKVLSNLFGTEWLSSVKSYKIGNIFKNINSEQVYILSKVGVIDRNKMLIGLICINDGNRWAEPQELSGNDVSEEEFAKITNNKPHLFIPIDEFSYSYHNIKK